MTIKKEKFYTARIKSDDIRSFLDHVDQSEILADSSECSESPTGSHHYVSYPRSSGGRGNNNFNCKYCGRDPKKDEEGGLRKHSNEQLVQKIMEDGARFIERYDPEREWDTWNLSLMASQLISLNSLVTFSVYVDDEEIESEKTLTYDKMMEFIKSERIKMPDNKIKYEIWNFKIGPAIFNPG
jgi:hypothetical protein